MCKRDSLWEPAVKPRKLSSGALWWLRGWDGGGGSVGERSKSGGIYVCIHTHTHTHTHIADSLPCELYSNYIPIKNIHIRHSSQYHFSKIYTIHLQIHWPQLESISFFSESSSHFLSLVTVLILYFTFWVLGTYVNPGDFRNPFMAVDFVSGHL